MAHYHILEVNQDGDGARVAFHIPVPNSDNKVGVNMRTALSQFRSTSSRVPFIESAENSLIVDGSIFEHIETVLFDPEATDAVKQQAIVDRATTLHSTFPDKVRAILDYWGYNGTVV